MPELPLTGSRSQARRLWDCPPLPREMPPSGTGTGAALPQELPLFCSGAALAFPRSYPPLGPAQGLPYPPLLGRSSRARSESFPSPPDSHLASSVLVLTHRLLFSLCSVKQRCLNEQKRRRQRATKKISIFIGSFVICFGPYIITRLVSPVWVRGFPGPVSPLMHRWPGVGGDGVWATPNSGMPKN